MDINLTNEQITVIGEIKNVLRDIILRNHGNTVEKTIEIFQEVVNEKFHNHRCKIEDIKMTNNDKIQVFIIIFDKLKFDFELDLNIPKDDSRFMKLVLECEPWRTTNPKLIRSEKRLKEWANTFGDK